VCVQSCFCVGWFLVSPVDKFVQILLFGISFDIFPFSPVLLHTFMTVWFVLLLHDIILTVMTTFNFQFLPLKWDTFPEITPV